MTARRPTERIVAMLLTAVLVLGAATARAARTDWRETVVGRFHLYSTLGDSATRAIARQLVAFEQTVVAVLRVEEPLPDKPTYIYILNHSDFERYAMRSGSVAGFFSMQEFANYLILDKSFGFDVVRESVLHEYTHYVQFNTSTIRFPPWYYEGYAELFSAFKFKDEFVELGGVPKNVHISLQHFDWIPVERLLAIKKGDPEWHSAQSVMQFYGESWALVHYLLFDNPDLFGPTLSYLANVDVGYPEADAFTHAFQIDKATLNENLRKLIHNERIVMKRWTFKQPLVIDQAQTRQLSPLEADQELARLIFEIHRPAKTYKPLIDAAVAENGASPTVRALAARIAAHSKEPIAIDELVARLRSGTDSPRERMDIADALLTSDPSEAHARQALTLLDDLTHMDSPPLEAVTRWAQAAQASNLPPAQLIAVLEPARARASHDFNILRLLGAAYLAAGERQKARDCYTRLILVSQTAQARLWAQRMVDSPRLQDVAGPAGDMEPEAEPEPQPQSQPKPK